MLVTPEGSQTIVYRLLLWGEDGIQCMHCRDDTIVHTYINKLCIQYIYIYIYMYIYIHMYIYICKIILCEKIINM